jgi:hypothetical protein
MATASVLTSPNVVTAPLAVLVDILGGPQRPGRHIRMQPPGAAEKYVFIKRDGAHQPITDAALLAHIDGRATYGGPLIGADGLARALVIELDVDAMAGARRVQEAARAFGVEMVSIVLKGAGSHDGSHNWARTTPCDPKAARALAKQIAAAAGYPDAETWPSETGIRYPLGVHTHTQRRGRALLPSGEILDADDPVERDAVWAALAALTPVEPPPLPKPQPKAARKVSLGEHAAERLDGPGAIARFNAEHTPAGILEAHGAEETRDGYTCPCGAAHGPGTKITIGERVAYCHSDNPACLLSKSRYPRGLDAWALECALSHGGNTTAMLKVVNPYTPRQRRQKRQEPPPPEQPEYLTVEAAERRRKDRERKRAQRQAAAAARREAALDWLNAHDDDLSKRDRRVALIHLDLIGQRDWHAASLARQAAMYAERFTNEPASELTIRTVQRANARLIELGLLDRNVRSKVPGSASDTAVWTLTVEPVSRIETPQTEAEGVSGGDTRVYIRTGDTSEQGEPASGAQEPPPPAAPEPAPAPSVEPAPVPRCYMWSPKEVWQDSDAGRQALADRWRLRPEAELDAADVAEQQQLAAVVAAPQPVVCFGPPASGTRDATRYWRLLRKADRVEREGNAKQAYALRQQAKRLEEPIRVVDELPADDLVVSAEVAALFAIETDDTFLPMLGVPVDEDDDWEAPVVDAAPPPLTSSRPEGPAEAPQFDYPAGYVDGMLARFRARLNAGGVMET